MGRPRKDIQSVSLSLRFEPKNKYLADIMARSQHKSLNRFVELAVEQALKLPNGQYQAEHLWDKSPVRRLEILATVLPVPLNFEEEHVWEAIRADRKLSTRLGKLHIDAIEDRWDELQKAAIEAKAKLKEEYFSQIKVRRRTR
jgi:hypothetical protein